MGIDVLTIALILTILGIGTFLSFRILNITDLTVEASFGFGAVICGLMCDKDHMILAIFLAFLGGCFTGLVTGLLHTKLKINAILSGILTLTAWYSVNIMVSPTRPNIALRGFSGSGLYDKTIFFIDSDVKNFFIMVFIVALVIGVMILFFRTRLGMSIRACGDNEQMTKAQCISTDMMKIIGLMISNGLVAISGALLVQFNGSYSTDSEKGMMVVGVATIIIGELITFKRHSIWLMLVGIMGGSIIYRFVYTMVLEISFIQPYHVLLIQAAFLVLILLGGIVADKLNGHLKLSKAKKIVDIEDGDLNA